MTIIDDPNATIKSYTIDEFCAVERISRATLYNLWAQDRGPRFYLVGSHRRVTESMRREWHARMEALASAELDNTSMPETTEGCE